MSDMLELIRANHVSAVVTESFNRSIDIVKDILKEKSRVWMCFPDNTTVLTTYNRFKEQKISVDYVKDKGNYKDSDVVLSTSNFIKKMLYKYFENGKITVDSLDFCDILVLGGVSLWKNDEMIIMNLWKKILDHKREIKVPRVVLSLFNLDIDNNIPFDLSQSYYYIDEKEDIKIFYHDDDLKLSDKNLDDKMFEVIKREHEKEELNRSFMVYCPGFKEVVSLTISLRKLDDVRLFFLTKELEKENSDKLYKMQYNGKRLIVVSSPILTPISNISVVFDCMIQHDEYKTPNESIRIKTSYISKAIATQRALMASEYCYRFCTEQKYESFKSQPSSESSRIPVTRIFLELVDRGLDPKSFFGDSLSYVTIREEIMELTKTKMVNIRGKDVKLNSLGEFFLNLNLSRYPSILLHRWIMKEQQIFPGIVLACIIDKADGMFFYLPSGGIQDKKDYFVKKFGKWASSSIIDTYLNMWKSFSDDIGDLKPTKEQLKEWCTTNSINFKTFDMLLNSIIETFDSLEHYRRRPITIGKFLPQKLLIKAADMIESVYSSKTFQVTDADKLRYIDSSHNSSFLDVQRHFNPYVKIPYRLVSFSNVTFIKDKKEIRKIVLFHPLNNKFVKGKYLEPREKTVYRIPPKPVKESYNMFPVYKPVTPVYAPSDSPEYRPTYPPSPDYKPPSDSPEYRPTYPPSPDYKPPSDSPEYRPSTPIPSSNIQNEQFMETSFEDEEPKSAPTRDILDQEKEEARLFREAFDDLSL